MAGISIPTLVAAKKNDALIASGIDHYEVDGTTLKIYPLGSATPLLLNFPTPVGIDKVEVDPTTNHLLIKLTDGSITDAGELPTGTAGVGDSVFIGNAAPDHTKYKVWIDTSEDGAGGSSILLNDIIATTVIGSVYAGKKYEAGTSLETPLRDILVSESAPVGVLTYEPTDKFYDVINNTVSDIKIKIKATKKTNDIDKIEFYVNDVVVKTLVEPTDSIKDGGDFDYDYHFTTPTNSNIKLKVVITDTNGLKANSNTVIKFVGKSYFGVVPETVVTPTDTDVKGLANDTLKDTASLTYQNIPIPQDGNLYKVLYAYPKEFGGVNKIVDADGRDYTSSYTFSQLQVDGIDYYAYILTDGTGTDGATQKFS